MSLEKVMELLSDGQTQVVQTHISVVFIKKDVVYKVKKPVNFGFVDFSTLEKRKFYCEEKVRLNKRLCPEIYLGVEPIYYNGEIIEYAVKMKPLPMEKSLKRLLVEGKVFKEDIRKVVEKIVDFHMKAETNEEIKSYGKTCNFRKNTDENFQQTEPFIGQTIDEESFNFIKEKTEEFYSAHDNLLDKRAKKGLVKDCHGDLHSEHIVLTDSICIFDCIEFNKRFRFIDIACDIAFLFMDLDYLQAKDLSLYGEKIYKSLLQDPDLDLLLPFFKCYRAYVRGKVNSLMSVDPNIPEATREERAIEARKYFDLAKEYARSW
ncbi:conserved hypothetical protein [Thermosulfidibacter takaii ABI70S6]|uniref:Aminoglycoside phosphotransferase domain-containing protein n=1 Tax=Thermosulfidibacter takaii (strain DSM 17441 / JCM 13301 / NBRC 103674 / ABI70S6) TaxID=1298851 RepID=A0A0S3QR82_THET7|nr:hypothetical protein [Thermosulfidibacter takaii]BAT70834.1 conserved hypothetical protein [Thermosulfidibacter takaii ABI70S6]